MRSPWTPVAVLAVGVTLTVALAQAQAPPVAGGGVALGDEPAPAPVRLRCQTFATDLEAGSTFDTHDLDTAVGQWLERQEATGWRLAGVDFEVGQKPTGFAQGYTQVCVSPRMR